MSNQLETLTTPVHLSYETYGPTEPALLLIHGFPLDHTIWAEQVEDLKNICRVIAPDLRGHGKSPAPKGAYGVDLLARDLLALLDQLGVYKAVWVGHSMGGYVAFAAWRMAPERFAGLGLVCTNHRADTEAGQKARYDLAAKVAEQGAAAAVNSKLFHPSTPENAPAVGEGRRIQLNAPADGVIGSLHAMATRPDSTDTLRTIHVPTLVVGGAGDQLFKPEIPAEMGRSIPGAKLVMAEKSGHMPMLEQPDLVTQELTWLVQASNT